MTEREKMIAGIAYDSMDPELIKLRFEARKLTGILNQLPPEKMNEKRELLEKLFGRIGLNILIEPNFRCDYGFNIFVGENFYANFDVVILDVAEVIIGDNCFIAPKVGIYTATHPINSVERNSGKEFGKKIVIGDNCWIGGSAVINPGVKLGNNVVVASGSVVTKSFGDNVVIGGNPAKIIKNIDA